MIIKEVRLSYLYIHFYVTRQNSKGAILLLYYGDKVAKRGSIDKNYFENHIEDAEWSKTID